MYCYVLLQLSLGITAVICNMNIQQNNLYYQNISEKISIYGARNYSQTEESLTFSCRRFEVKRTCINLLNTSVLTATNAIAGV